MAIRFLKDALQQAIAPEWRLLAIILLVLATATNAVILSELDSSGQTRSLAFVIAALVRLAGLMLIIVALLRRATGSSRAAFMPDGAFWLRTVFAAFVMALAVAIQSLLPGEPGTIFVSGARHVLVVLIATPLAVWSVALAVEKPLAIDPRPWLRNFSQWLLPLIVGHLIFVLPIGLLHGYIDIGLLQGTIERSLWLEVADGALSCVIMLMSLGLMVTAYRRVANR